MGRMATSLPARAATRSIGDEDSGRWILWVGSAGRGELGLARAAVAEQVQVVDAPHPQAATSACGTGARSSPLFIVLASDRPGRWPPAEAVLLSRRWPLAPIVSVAASLSDGSRRSGPQLPGVEEVAWHHLGGRCGWWLAGLEERRPAGLGLPTTARREERLLESLSPLSHPAGSGRLPPTDVSIAAPRDEDLEPLADLLTAAGCRVAGRAVGRPSLDAAARTVIWDVGRLAAGDFEWLRLMAANRPGVAVVLLESFPRGDAVEIALRAGAAAVLGRPVPLDVLAGTMLSLSRAVPRSHLGPERSDR
ncbi:MAG: hypothetical protein RLZZ111_1803 [Planctomycetota bacterium]